jgi:hypothetical protein
MSGSMLELPVMVTIYVGPGSTTGIASSDSCKFEHPIIAKRGRNDSQKGRRKDKDRDRDRHKEQRQHSSPRSGPPSYSHPMWANLNASPEYGYPYGWGCANPV